MLYVVSSTFVQKLASKSGVLMSLGILCGSTIEPNGVMVFEKIDDEALLN